MNFKSILYCSFFIIFASHSSYAENGFNLVVREDSGQILISATPPPQFKINRRYPNSVRVLHSTLIYHPISPEEEVLSFKLPLDSENISTSLGYCNQSSCRVDIRSFKWNSAKKSLDPIETPRTPQFHSPKADTSPSETKDENFLSSLESAFARAKTENKPILVHIYGRSCWVCNLMDEEVLTQKEYLDASSVFVRVKLDIGEISNLSFIKEIKANLIPQNIYLDLKGDEIGRDEGYYSLKNEIRNLKLAYQDRYWPVSRLNRIILSGQAEQEGSFKMIKEEAALRLARFYAKRHSYHEALRLLEKSHRDDSDLQLEIEIGIIQTDQGGWSAEFLPTDLTLLEKLAALEKKRVSAHQDSVDSLDWRLNLARVYEKLGDHAKRDQTLNDLLQLVRTRFKDKTWLIQEGPTVAIAEDYEIRAFEMMGKKAKERDANQRAIKKFRTRLDNSKGLSIAGLMDHMASEYLPKLGEMDQAEHLFQSLEKDYPEEGGFYWEHARFLSDRLDLPETKKNTELQKKLLTQLAAVSEAGLKKVHGNWVFVLSRYLARSWVELGEREKAIKFLEIQSKKPGGDSLSRFLVSLKSKP